MDDSYGCFTTKFTLQLQPLSSSPGHHQHHHLPLGSLTFAIKDIFDVHGQVTGFGNPDWGRTHSAATSTAPAVLAVLEAGAKCVGRTVMDEMAFSVNGENKHYGTPTNPCAPDRVPGGSSSGSAVAVAARLVDFSLGTDTAGSVRIPASFCGVFGFRPSHGAISCSGVIPLAQSVDTVGWFATDPEVLNRVGRVLLKLPRVELVRPTQFIIANDCFGLTTTPSNLVPEAIAKSVEKLFGGDIVKHSSIGDYIKDTVPSLKAFMSNGHSEEEYNIQSLVGLSGVLRLLQQYEFKNNHGEWVKSVKPDLDPRIYKRVWEALGAAFENVDVCRSVKTELHAALSTLLGDYGVLVIPTHPGSPPVLQTPMSQLQAFRTRALSLTSIAGVSGFCQVSIPLGKCDGLPVSVSLLAKHGSDGFLLNLVEALYDTLKQDWISYAPSQ